MADTETQVVQGPADVPPSYLRALRHRPLLFLWLSQVISQSGDFIFEMALLWLVLFITNSATDVAITVSVILVPAVVIGPIVGVYIDRVNRRDAMLAAVIFQGIVISSLAALFLLGMLTFLLILVMIFLLASGMQVSRGASQAMIPSLVGPEDLGAANSLFTLSSSINQLATLGIGGIVIGIFGYALPIVYDGIMIFVAAGLLAMVPRIAATVKFQGQGVEGARRTGFLSELVEGFRYIGRSRILLEVVGIAVILNFFGAMVTALLAPYAKFVLHGGTAAYGFIGACIALGGIAGALAAGKIDMRRHMGVMLFGGIVCIGVAILFWGLFANLYLALGMGLAMGIGSSFANLPIQVLVQAKTPGRLLGRVVTALTASATAFQPVAALFGGILALSLPVGEIYLLNGVGFLLISLIGLAVLRELRQARF
jgi:predicted MFS family arabinose efflux permease